MIDRKTSLYKIDEETRRICKEKEKEKDKEIREILEDEFKNNNIKIINIKRNINEYEELTDYQIEYEFNINSYKQQDITFWNNDESLDFLIDKVNKHIGYIKELREEYPEYCMQNDFIQANRNYKKELVLTHMGYERKYSFDIELCDYLKLPNTTDCGFGGGDYEIKRTPKRLKEYNENIDKTIDMLLDCISDLKKMKYVKNEE